MNTDRDDSEEEPRGPVGAMELGEQSDHKCKGDVDQKSSGHEVPLLARDIVCLISAVHRGETHHQHAESADVLRVVR